MADAVTAVKRRAEGGSSVRKALAQVAAEFKISVRTLQRWWARLKAATRGELLQKAIELACKRRAAGRKGALSEKQRNVVIALLTKSPNAPIRVSVRQLHDGLGALGGEQVPSRGAVGRFARRWLSENRATVTALLAPDKYRGSYRVALGDAGQAVAGLNAEWQLDGSPFDVLASDNKRYKILAGIDCWSRRAVAILAPDEDTRSVLLLLRRMVLAFGVVARVRTDNGAAFTSQRFRRGLKDLGIEQVICPPYRGDKKAFIERFIGTLQHDFAEQLPGFAGHSVADRAKQRGRLSFAQRRGLKESQILGATLSVDEIRAALAAWIELYNSRLHSALPDGRSPGEMAAAWVGSVERVSNERLLDLLLAEGGPKVVGRKGIRHENLHYWSPDLVPLVGQRVYVLLGEDIGRVVVLSADRTRFIGIAENIESAGIDRQTLAIAAAQGQKTFISEAKRAVRRAGRGINMAALRDRVSVRRSYDPSMPLGEVVERETPALRAMAAAQISLHDDSPLAAPTAMTPAERAELDAKIEEIQRKHRGTYDEEREAAATVERYRQIVATPRAEWTQSDAEFVEWVEPLPEIQALKRCRVA